jgi:hypothetical protein
MAGLGGKFPWAPQEGPGGAKSKYKGTVKAVAGATTVNAIVVNAKTLPVSHVDFCEIFRVFGRILRFRKSVKYKCNFHIKHKMVCFTGEHTQSGCKIIFRNSVLYALILPKGALPRIVCGKGRHRCRLQIGASRREQG